MVRGAIGDDLSPRFSYMRNTVLCETADELGGKTDFSNASVLEISRNRPIFIFSSSFTELRILHHTKIVIRSIIGGVATSGDFTR